jgi:hypothetical protein
MWRIELLAFRITLLSLALLLPSCDSGNGPSVTTERVIAEVNAPTSVTVNENFQVTGTAFGERTDNSSVPVDSIKLFFQDALTGSSFDGAALTVDIDSSMTSIGTMSVRVEAWKTAEGERLSDEAVQDIKVITAPPQTLY